MDAREPLVRRFVRRVHAGWDSDLAYSFRSSPVTVIAALVALTIILAAVFAPWIAPQNPFDPAALDLNAAFKPPPRVEGGEGAFPLGTDNQGRDILSTIMHGARISLGIGLASVVFAMVLGVSLGLLAGYVGGRMDAVIMRVADVQLSFPAILIALLIDGVARVALGGERHEAIVIPVLVLSIGFAGWVQYARTVRGSTMVEMAKEYVQAARQTLKQLPPGEPADMLEALAMESLSRTF
jgi:peptide/nickel transport system permease protein